MFVLLDCTYWYTYVDLIDVEMMHDFLLCGFFDVSPASLQLLPYLPL